MVACRIAKILATKVAVPQQGTGVRQDITNGDCMKFALMLLKDLQSGKAILGDAALISTDVGVNGFPKTDTDHCPQFQVGVEQW